jgi:YD repeat-containing protein
MTERERWALRGPVHTCRLQRTWYSRKCGAEACETEERGDITSLEFRADGSLVRRWHHNPDGSEWTTTYAYDDAGRVASARTEKGSGVVEIQFYEHDDVGRLVRVIARSGDGGDQIAESYEYDVAGHKKKTLHVDVATQSPDTLYCWGVEGTNSSYSAPGATTPTTLYNEHEQPTDLLLYDGANRLLSHVEFRYDGDGNLVEEAQTTVAEMLSPQMLASLNQAQLETVRGLLGAAGHPKLRIHRYDERGRRIETRSPMGPLGEVRNTVAYNDHDDPIQEVCEEEDREYGMDEGGRLSDAPSKVNTSRSESRFRYDYDAFRNWVTKTVESCGGTGQEFTVSGVERRMIGYFE